MSEITITTQTVTTLAVRCPCGAQAVAEATHQDDTHGFQAMTAARVMACEFREKGWALLRIPPLGVALARCPECAPEPRPRVTHQAVRGALTTAGLDMSRCAVEKQIDGSFLVFDAEPAAKAARVLFLAGFVIIGGQPLRVWSPGGGR